MVVTVLERGHINPPWGSIPTTTLPLSFLDIPWLRCHPVQSISLYDFVQPVSYFVETTLPLLKSSLSSTLVDFFPFAANIIIPHHPGKPRILYTDGDFVSLTVVESTIDFNQLVDGPLQDAAVVHPLVPHLPPTRISEDGDFVSPIMAIQITVFPNSGICVGIEFLHVAADGKSFHDFMKAWATTHRSGANLNCPDEDLIRPFHDRRTIRDPNGLESIFLDQGLRSKAILKSHPVPVDKVRGTFHLSRSQLDRLKDSVLNESGSTPRHLSKFVVACAFVWHCWIIAHNKSSEVDKKCHMILLADCRSSLGYPIPTSYFGNCLSIKTVSVSRGLLIGKGGITHAAKAIGDAVKEMKENPLEGLEGWCKDSPELMKHSDLVAVAGSPRFKVYDTDFGWGKPRKHHRVHIDNSKPKAFIMSDSRQGDDVVEIDLALDKLAMQKFASVFAQLDA